MFDNLFNQLSRSSRDFIHIVAPKLKELRFIEGELIPIEVATDEKFRKLAQNFDMLSGIDIWQVVEEKGIRGIASRIQWDCDYKSFTIRKSVGSGNETEYDKRLRAVKNDEWLYPYYTIQAYIRDTTLTSLAIAKTKDIIRMIELGYCETRVNSSDGNQFYIVYWNEMKENGCDIKTN